MINKQIWKLSVKTQRGMSMKELVHLILLTRAMGTSCNQIQNCIFRDKSQECKCSQLKGSTFTIKSVSIQVGWHWCCKHYIQINRKQGTCSFSTRASNSLILAWDISDTSSSRCLSRCSVPISSVIFLFSSYISGIPTQVMQLGCLVAQWLKHWTTDPEAIATRIFFT